MAVADSVGDQLSHGMDYSMLHWVQYLGLQALVSEIINKLELVYDIVASFDILM